MAFDNQHPFLPTVFLCSLSVFFISVPFFSPDSSHSFNLSNVPRDQSNEVLYKHAVGQNGMLPLVTETMETRVFECICVYMCARVCMCMNAWVQSCFGVKALQSSCNWENDVFHCDHIAIWVYCCHHDLAFIACLESPRQTLEIDVNSAWWIYAWN